jgi:hypothetical protein
VKARVLVATILMLMARPAAASSPGVLMITHPIDSKLDFLCMTNVHGQYVNSGVPDPGGCVLTRTQIDMSGDRDYDVWECLEDNSNPGVDQRDVLTDTFGNPLTEKARKNTKKPYAPVP